MESSRKQDGLADRTAALTQALGVLARPGIRFSPLQFAGGTLLLAAGLALCVHFIFGGDGLNRAWAPIGVFLTCVVALAVYLSAAFIVVAYQYRHRRWRMRYWPASS